MFRLLGVTKRNLNKVNYRKQLFSFRSLMQGTCTLTRGTSFAPFVAKMKTQIESTWFEMKIELVS